MAQMQNRTEVTRFILLGLSSAPELQSLLCIMFTVIYLVTLVGNLGMITLILLDSRLHTPMYFFLSNLSLVDFGYSSAVTPKAMAGLLIGDKFISYNACAAQMFFFVAFATVENYLLASMAYDRYAAVCRPLHYTTTMTTSVCAHLAIGSYICGFLNACFHVGDIFSLTFCKSNMVHHFFCDVPAVLALSCSEKHISEVVLVFLSSFNVSFALLVILISYLFIFVNILKMHSAQGHQKALSTCASHFTTVSIFYGTVIFMYVQPSSSHSMDTDKVASVFYAVVIPMLNPVVYSLRNKEVKSAFKKFVFKVCESVFCREPPGRAQASCLLVVQPCRSGYLITYTARTFTYFSETSNTELRPMKAKSNQEGRLYFTCVVLAVLGLRRGRGFALAVESRAYPLAGVRELLAVVAGLVSTGHRVLRLQSGRRAPWSGSWAAGRSLSGCGAWAQLPASCGIRLHQG
ncbi:olfactory receptor 5B2-like [Dama dama]|uniref:olfactory receptor 5B2-like n=1 Tax=Dama dama TaxID=30532 RepID=UPI002A368BA6|nr:olfactory receptor 5B2-like [Dama dama]